MVHREATARSADPACRPSPYTRPPTTFASRRYRHGSQTVPVSPTGHGNGTQARPPRLSSALTATHDFNGDGKSDIVWRNTGGTVAMWLMNGGAISQVRAASPPYRPTYSIVGQRDFNGDGDADLLWRDTSGNLAMWFMNGLTMSSSAALGNVPTNWTVDGHRRLQRRRQGRHSLAGQRRRRRDLVHERQPSRRRRASARCRRPAWSIASRTTTGDILWRDSIRQRWRSGR